MRIRMPSFTAGAFLILSAAVCPLPAISQTAGTADQAVTSVAVRDIQVRDHTVSAEVVNKSPYLVRDIELLVRYTWHWSNEFHPGREDPGRAAYVEVEKEIRPGESMPFNYQPTTPLPERTDGYFKIDVSVAGFTKIIPG